MKTNGGQYAGQGETAIFENDQCARRVAALREQVIDSDTEHPFGLGWVAVTRVP